MKAKENGTFDLTLAYGTFSDCWFVVGEYRDSGKPYIGIENEKDGPITDVTVAVDTHLNGCAIKNYSENEGLLPELMELGLVEEINGYEQLGFCRLPICEINMAVLKQYSK